jgi:septal ring factor EnvC (AmiA/AmiB activator)
VKRAAPALALGLLLPLGAAGAQAPAAPPGQAADQRLRAVRERRLSLEREVARLRSEERSLLGEVERLELELRLRAEELRETQLLLQRTSAEIHASSRRARELEKRIGEERPVLAARARALYKLGEVSYLRLLLSVDRPADLLRGYRFVSALARRDNQRFAAFRADLGALQVARDQLTRQAEQAQQLREGQERTRRRLDADRRRKTELLTSLVEQKETNTAYLQELAQAEVKLGELLGGLGSDEVAVPIAAFKGTLPWPAGGRVRVPFGRRRHPRFDTYTVSNGIEIATPADAPVLAVHEGSVVFADHFRGYGLMVVLDHGGKHHTLYAHLAEAGVAPGQRAAAGQTIGTAGAGLEGPGLYFEMRFQGRAEDPLEWLSGDGER